MDVDLTVETEHSRYDFDTEAKLFTRTRVHEDAATFFDVVEPRSYDSITDMTVGQRMTVWYEGQGRMDARFLHSMPVVSITDHLEKVKA